MERTSEQPGSLDYDKQALIARLRASARHFLGTLRDVSEEDARILPTPNAWSIREVAEHVAVAEMEMLTSLMHGTPTHAESDLIRDLEISTIVANRTLKQQAPEVSRPTGRYPSLELAAADFEDARRRTIDYVKGDIHLRRVSVRHPLYVTLDGYQILLVMTLHPERHALQIEEIKNSAPYLDLSRPALKQRS
jgi:hypothetical protein